VTSAAAGHLSRRTEAWTLGMVPFVALVGGWLALPYLVKYPAYMLPSVGTVLSYALETVRDGSLLANIGASLTRLVIGFVIGKGLAIPLGIAIALNRTVADLFRPLLSFLQAIAGIAWVPLTLVWFGIGNGSVIFVIANTIFFSALYNTVIGVQSIPLALHRAVRSHGGEGLSLLTNLILPGALVQILLGVRTSLAYGWRALVAAEMIAGSNGLGYMTMEAVQWQRTETIILGMIVIGILWVLMDRLIFTPIERRTVGRWGLLQR
jgi:NitT/TauT family transport system permease protein/taurine transport system permease protein